MAKLTNGLLGGFTGKLGPFVGSTWRGMPVVRTLPVSGRKRKPTPGQKKQQAKFSLMMGFLKPLGSFLNQVYGPTAGPMTGFNKVFSYNLLNAVAGAYPDWRIDYALVVLGSGKSGFAEEATATVDYPMHGRFMMNWRPGKNAHKEKDSDRAFAAVYCKALDQWIVLEDAAVRSACGCLLDVPAFAGKLVQTWLGFLSSGGQPVSPGVYTGQVFIPDSPFKKKVGKKGKIRRLNC